jgi:hypothetical protein
MIGCCALSTGRNWGGKNVVEKVKAILMRASFTSQYSYISSNSFSYPRPDLLEPHILRSLSNIKIASIHASCCGCHFILLDVDGAAWMFGRNASSALGLSGEDAISEDAPRRVLPTDLGADEGTKFVHAACGRSHSLLVGDDGQVWSAGANNLGQVSHTFSSRCFLCRLTGWGMSVRTSGYCADTHFRSD